MKADLHVHSVFSDGLMTPDELCLAARDAGLTHMALCDHDTVDGLAPMRSAVARAGAGLALLCGVELSSASDGRTHILGYGVHAADETLLVTLREARARRWARGKRMLARLSALGVDVPEASIPDDPGRPLSRAHIARALVAIGAVHTVRQAFERYLNPGCPAYEPYERPTPTQSVRLLAAVGAAPVLAHPARLALSLEALFAFIHALKADGLAGVEVYHPSADRRFTRALEPFVRREGLLVTGGSDFHGDPGARAALGDVPSGWTREAEDVEALWEAVGEDEEEDEDVGGADPSFGRRGAP